jgi:predicted site-specific integrase-resolvase
MPELDPMLTREAVAALLRISVRTLARLEERGAITGVIRVSPKRCLYRQSAVEKFLAMRERAQDRHK